jgi:hypothetical protein
MEAAARYAEARVREREIPGRRHRNVHVAAMLEQLATTRYAFPAYVLAYRYRDTVYRAVVHGQKSELLLGKAPFSYMKAVLVAAAVLGVLLLLGLLAGS